MYNLEYLKNNLEKIEEIEKDILLKIAWILKDSLEDFSTSMDRTLKYLDKIVLPIIMSSKEAKSYNPFAEIIEKYITYILIDKLKKQGYNLLSLSYSSDLTFEDNKNIINIDIKTANINNLSDFKKTINIGINQLTHVAQISLNKKLLLNSPFFVYPTIPPYYEEKNKKVKLNLTYGLMFIYPSYKDLIDKIREEYKKIYEFFKKFSKKLLISTVIENFNISTEEIEKIIEKKSKKSKYTKNDIITENLIRGIFIHKQEKDNILKFLKIQKKYNYIEKFYNKLENFTIQLQDRDIKPIAIITISLPNGLLKERYIDKFVSRKDYGKSARFHYKSGIFEIIKEKNNQEYPRILFVDLNKEYLDELKKYFGKIKIIDYQFRAL